jgi:integrase
MRPVTTGGAIGTPRLSSLRASELVSLRWDDIDFTAGKLHVRRAKGGTTVHLSAVVSYGPAEAKV